MPLVEFELNCRKIKGECMLSMGEMEMDHGGYYFPAPRLFNWHPH